MIEGVPNFLVEQNKLFVRNIVDYFDQMVV